jgi:hypothetical protein
VSEVEDEAGALRAENGMLRVDDDDDDDDDDDGQLFSS